MRIRKPKMLPVAWKEAAMCALLAGACHSTPQTGISKETTSGTGTSTSTTSSGTGASAPTPCKPPANCVCPTNLQGPDLVLVPGPNGSAYCMDARETTRAEYDSFLAAKSSDTSGQPSECSWNVAYTPLLWPNDPTDDTPPSEPYCPPASWNDALPDAAVSCVDFCDARAYCAWAGKRLCGRVGGPAQWGDVYQGFTGPSDFPAFEQAVASADGEFFNACSQGGLTSYPYGNQYQAEVCIDQAWVTSHGSTALVVTETTRGCHGAAPPFDAIHDLSGSVWEWQNLCGTWGSSALSCSVMGGSYVDTDPKNLACAALASPATMTTVAPNWGFRCCADTVLSP